jgi:hypothetical protein
MKKIIATASILFPALAFGAYLMMTRPNPDADTSTRRISKAGLYEVSYEPAVSPVPKRSVHGWTITVRARDGRPVDGATIGVDGGMPDHGHGLPTQPFVRAALGGGRYAVDGMKFNMGGYWVVDLAISGAAGADTVRFELNL